MRTYRVFRWKDDETELISDGLALSEAEEAVRWLYEHDTEGADYSVEP